MRGRHVHERGRNRMCGDTVRKEDEKWEKWEVCVRGYRKENKKVGGKGEKSIYYSRANPV